ncbi:MAG: hypothetical protein NTU53_17645 [Planctomycetota bacterium]|nr:hypothetical protein [Planctomycetota bacterium]
MSNDYPPEKVIEIIEELREWHESAHVFVTDSRVYERYVTEKESGKEFLQSEEKEANEAFLRLTSALQFDRIPEWDEFEDRRKQVARSHTLRLAVRYAELARIAVEYGRSSAAFIKAQLYMTAIAEGHVKVDGRDGTAAYLAAQQLFSAAGVNGVPLDAALEESLLQLEANARAKLSATGAFSPHSADQKTEQVAAAEGKEDEGTKQEKSTLNGVTPESEPDYQFEIIGGAWHLRFPGDEPNVFEVSKQGNGFDYIAKLLQNPNREMSAIELEGTEATPINGGEALDEGLSPVTALNSANELEDAKETAKSLGPRLRTLKQLRDQLSEELEESRSFDTKEQVSKLEAELQEAEQEIERIEEYGKSVAVEAEHVNRPEDKRCRDRVRGAIKYALEGIQKRGMSGLHRFLSHLPDKFSYEPPNPPPSFKLR